ncbi:MAG: TonB-dependent receptor [Acidobacteriota bacterium]|nr:TonB-dependent receptor [Acidobacteriota bacterium]
MLRRIFAKSPRKFPAAILAVIFLAGNVALLRAQTSEAVLSGIVVDQNGAVVPAVEITILNVSGTLERTVSTDAEGYFTFPFLPPGEYVLRVKKEGFDAAEIPDLALNENSQRTLRIELKINPLSETVKVTDELAPVEEKFSGGATFNRRSMEDLPLNAGSFQSAINLVPGVVLVPVTPQNLGQFSVNGQRTNSNYFTADGVSANFGTTNYNFLGQTGGGSIPATNIQGGLDNLVSSEAIEEVKIQTLVFAPAFGRAPGAQVSLVSRSGGNDFSFSLFENFRNDAFNARDFFDLEKPPLRYNNFGGSAGGPVIFPPFKPRGGNRSFFFLSYEMRKFVQPQPTVITMVPTKEFRENAPNEITRAILNTFPLPTGKDVPNQFFGGSENLNLDDNQAINAPEIGEFRATYSDPNFAESFNLRLDQIITSKISVFARYNYSPSFSENRNPANLSAFFKSSQTTRTLTLGSTQTFTSRLINEFRANFSEQNASTSHKFDGLYGGEIPSQTLFVPSSFDGGQTNYQFNLNSFPNSLRFSFGNYADNKMRQVNVVDNVSYALNSHELKFGFDYRRLSPTLAPAAFGIGYDFNKVESLTKGVADRVFYYRTASVTTRALAFSTYFQDNWKINPALSLLYGVRWEINPSPSTEDEKLLLTLVEPPDLNKADLSDLKIAPGGTPYYQTRYNNFAPRFGIAYQLSDKTGRETILRAAAGTFYDLGQSQFGEIGSPYERVAELAENLALPISNHSISLSPGLINKKNRLAVVVASDDYTLPRTYIWNLTAEQRLGENQRLSIAYVGAAGRNLQRTLTLDVARPDGTHHPDAYFSPAFSRITFIDNAFSSDYHSLQIQFSRRLSSGLEVFANYTWAHSIDDYSSDSNISAPGYYIPASLNRGNSDFDVRHSFNAAFSYDLPSLPKSDSFLDAVLKNWSLSGIFFARSGLPFDVKISEINRFGFFDANRRPDLIGGLPLYVADAASPTGYRLNADAFARPASDTGQGNLGRNALVGPGAWQLDLGLKKKFRLTGKSDISFRWDVYNVFNHPNFNNPYSNISYRQNGQRSIPSFFGTPTLSMARGYAASENTGGVNPVLQVGGARAMQFSLRLKF